MVWSATVSSFGGLLLARVLLGAVTAAAGPLVASLVGDYFEGSERGRIYSYVLTGELVGGGIGFAVTGDIAALSWRAAFVLLALPAFFLAWYVLKLPEPARGGVAPLVAPTHPDQAQDAAPPSGEPDAGPAADPRRRARAPPTPSAWPRREGSLPDADKVLPGAELQSMGLVGADPGGAAYPHQRDPHHRRRLRVLLPDRRQHLRVGVRQGAVPHRSGPGQPAAAGASGAGRSSASWWPAA